MLTAIATMTVLVLISGLGLGWAGILLRAKPDSLIDRIDALLPQTQCRQCNFPGCRPYAEAIAHQQADINQCPPGGATGIRALANLLGREAKPLNPDNGEEKPKTLVQIDEQRCIGCTLCIQACPVDAIVGASKLMHTVIESECTGCNLCLPPCPVDCIDVVGIAVAINQWRNPRPLALATLQ